MDPDILILFAKAHAALHLYQVTEAKIMEAFSDAGMKAIKTQVGYFNKHDLAWLWSPIRPKRDGRRFA